MKKFYTLIALAIFLFSSIAFACDSGTTTDDPSCKVIANACKAAGFERKSAGKQFWTDCMKPILLGKNVNGVKVDAEQVKSCRMKKIDELQKELKELQDVK